MYTKYDMIEELAHAVDLANIVYKNWVVETDAYNFVTVATYKIKHTKRITISSLVDSRYNGENIENVVVNLFIDSRCFYTLHLPSCAKLIYYVLIPMIEQHLNGERSELKGALSDLTSISPASLKN